jgi:cobalt/nickel transport system permease protein
MIVQHLRDGHVMRSREGHPRISWFSRLDPRAKILGVFAFVAASAFLTDSVLVAVSLVGALAFVFVSGVQLPAIAKAYAAALFFILFASVSIFLFSGLEKGLEMLGRASACVLALLVLVTGTETFELFGGLRRLRVPSILTTLLMLTHRYVFVLSEELSRMKVARKARGFSGGRSLLDRGAFRVLANTAGMLLVRAGGRADRIFEALKARGFSGEMDAWRTTRIALADVAFLAALWAFASLMLYLEVAA